jgi:hypothetical protein
MGLYSKFNVNFKMNGVNYTDCRAFYLKEDRGYQRVGADEFNNCENCLTENEVMNERVRIGIPFASLKTEEEMQPNMEVKDEF